MSSSAKLRRALRAYAEGIGFKYRGTEPGGKHVLMLLTTPGGLPIKFATPSGTITETSHLALNLRTELRRIAAGRNQR